jgi:2',3'-cyclic-nucleotide 2'-phosphodiesterase (5'-nucleotidase family)
MLKIEFRNLMVKKVFLLCFLLLLCAANVRNQTIAPDVLVDTSKAQTFNERLGTDDGAAFAILYGANLRGNLDLCDCNHPRGGIARRVGYVEAFKQHFKDTPVLQVEVGNFWYDSSIEIPHVLLQNDYVSRAYSRWMIDVINLGRLDLSYANRLFDLNGIAERTTNLPMMQNVISANAKLADSAVAPPPYIIKEVSGKRIKNGKKLRVGFLGLVEPQNVGSGMTDAGVKNIYEMARKFVPELRKKCDVLIILSYSEYAAAMRLAKENPEADLVIAGNAEALYKPRLVGKTVVLYAAPGNTQEGDLRFYIASDGKISFKFRSSDLDALTPSDEAALKFAEEARNEVFRLKNK